MIPVNNNIHVHLNSLSPFVIFRLNQNRYHEYWSNRNGNFAHNYRYSNHTFFQSI